MKTIFVGPFGRGGVPKDGASIKNYHILKKIRSLIPGLKAIDTDGWKTHPQVLLRLLATILANPRAKYILSLNNGSANKVIRILKLLAPNARVIYWVIGGTLGKWLLEGKVKVSDYAWLENIILEGSSMNSELKEAGMNNGSVMPNFKSIVTISDLKKTKSEDDKIRFVFLSRILPQKGCNLILEAARSLNAQGFSDKYSIDFFGPVESSYEENFKGQLYELDNVNYKGFLDLRDTHNYSELSKYDAMLFPTFWPGEGCPGIVIDAYICGLPILASDWNLNSDYIIDGMTGVLFAPKDVNALETTIRRCIDGQIDLEKLGQNALEISRDYDTDAVLSKNKLIKYGIIDA